MKPKGGDAKPGTPSFAVVIMLLYYIPLSSI
jgi:hypothetical protein